ncbi:hypothetical protein SAMN05216223_112175 [Actinacidiphila yanglinensis]|uniref:Uncharacterized protein n=1 Tax=Actinacidiphila yanglinensis TaxID=310779 RepID=A0A1H6D7A4_9ACTN|nr:hypothetical protein [Actinacidiphila yanglinensis]SEG81141.1 hypothetical protein SAMN05216223_112175 [Actinacidiphila yanglinensis]
MTSGPAPGTVFRVVWVPGTDRLRGWCWCGAERESDDPVELWESLLAHPGTHPGPHSGGPLGRHPGGLSDLPATSPAAPRTAGV